MNIQVFERAGMGFVSFRPNKNFCNKWGNLSYLWTFWTGEGLFGRILLGHLQRGLLRRPLCKIEKFISEGCKEKLFLRAGEWFFQKQSTDGDREVGGRGPSSYFPPHARHKLNLSPCTGISVLKLIYLCSYPAILPFLDSFLQSRPRNQVFLLQGNYLLFKNVFA